MELTGEFRIPAKREAVWDALNDPEVLKSCIVGCEEMEKSADDTFTARVKAKVGPVSAVFSGTVELSDLDPPRSYTISGRGQGGVAGFAKGSARVVLEEDGEGTVLRYTAKADVGGKLAQVGSRLVQGVAAKTAEDFFSRFSTHLTGEAVPAPVKPVGAGEPAPVPASEAKRPDLLAGLRCGLRALGGLDPTMKTLAGGVVLWLLIVALMVL